MRALPSWFPFERLQWAFPIAVTLHNLEEAIWLPSRAAQRNVHLPWRVAAAQFRIALIILTFAAYLVTWLSVRFVRQRGWMYLFVAYAFAMFLNVWAPDVPASILFRGYTPGVVSAVFLNFPVTGTLLITVFRERVIPSRAIAVFVFGFPLGIAIFFAVLFADTIR